ncbi:MAG: hypothetical protein JO257_18005 [Deltaproteobacteria bacterium]|nr:hypothetical protein [Deltaproteobacteria bacterium]
MHHLDLDELDSVRGGMGEGLLQAAGPIMNGIANIIGAAKSGGQPAAQAAPADAGAAGCSNCLPRVSVSVISGAR